MIMIIPQVLLTIALLIGAGLILQQVVFIIREHFVRAMVMRIAKKEEFIKLLSKTKKCIDKDEE